ncbi:MAG: nucleoside transporter C-terminal domain-containing protein [Bifidobacteriaceae bacterium]|nr:nucleoside transporter C-terminal domain-containing protein [Bifidobacteriaceae bacterium]
MYLVINIIGVLVFVGLGWVFSANRKKIRWKSVGIMVVLNVLIAWILTSFEWGRAAVNGAAQGFTWLVSVADKGISFAFGWWALPYQGSVTFIVSALLPILLVVPLFDTLTYIGFLPWVIKWIGRFLSFITRQPKFETFFAVEMMFLGNTEALAVSKVQLQKMKPARDVVIAMMSMSCVTAAILASYIQMVPGQFVLTAVPLNCVNALIIANMLYPAEVTKEEDVIYNLGDEDKTPEQIADAAKKAKEDRAIVKQCRKEGKPIPEGISYVPWYKRIITKDPNKPKKEPFFSFLGDSILGAGKLILIIIANVIAFVALAALIDKILGAFWDKLSLESILGVFLYIPCWLLGLPAKTAWSMSQLAGLKLVTNEFVAMGDITKSVATFAPHYKAVITVFLTSFANFGTLGMIVGAFKSIVDRKRNDAISRQVWRIFVSGILVSLMSAAMVGLFVW